MLHPVLLILPRQEAMIIQKSAHMGEMGKIYKEFSGQMVKGPQFEKRLTIVKHDVNKASSEVCKVEIRVHKSDFKKVT